MRVCRLRSFPLGSGYCNNAFVQRFNGIKQLSPLFDFDYSNGGLVSLSSLLPGGEAAGGEGGLDVDEALVAAAAKAQGDVTLSHQEGAVHEDVEFADDIKQGGILFYFFPSVAGIAPDVVAQFLLDAVDEGARALGLLQGVTTAEGDRGFVIGDDLHQFVEGAFFPTPGIPGVRIVATGTTMAAARQID